MYGWIKNKKPPSSPYKEILELLYQNPNILNLEKNENWLADAFSKNEEEMTTILIQNETKKKICSFIVSGSKINPCFAENCKLVELESWINENQKFKVATIQLNNNS